MGFVVLHMEKAHGSDSGTTAHIERFIIPKNADPTRTHLNRKLVTYPDGIKDRTAAIQKRLEEAGLTRKIGNNQVRAIRINVSGTHEDMKRIEKEGRLDEWCADNMKYFADLFGKENIVAAHLHRDEETPHIHITLVPIVKGERKRKKREEQVKKRYRKKPTNAVRLCADDIMTRLKLKSYQDSYAIAMAKYGLQRGIDGSQARHKSTQQYYRDIQKLADSLKSEVVDLQEQKTEAERNAYKQQVKDAVAKRSLELNENDPDTLIVAGRFFLMEAKACNDETAKAENQAKGELYFRQALNLIMEDERLDYLFTIGAACFDTQNFKLAAQYYEQINREFPDNAPATYFFLAYCYFYLEEAISCMHYIAKMKHELPDAYSNLGTSDSILSDTRFNELMRNLKDSVNNGKVDLDNFL